MKRKRHSSEQIIRKLREAKVVIGDFRLEYNHRRPHSSLNDQTPATFAALDCAASCTADHEVHFHSGTLIQTGT
jgi:hypothetical protein